MWSIKQREFLGLTNKEYALLNALDKSGLNTTLAAAKAKLPRVTALRLLTTLWRRGFVARHKTAREVRWSLVSSKLVRKRLELGLEGQEQTTHGKRVPLSDIASVSVYKGAGEMLASNQKILAAHPGERIYCIEPNAVWRHVAKVSAHDWTHLNKMLKQKNIIAEVILEEGFEKSMGGTIDDILSESFFAIAQDIRVASRGSLPAPVEVIIFRYQVLFLDWEQLIAVEIASPSTIKIMKGLFLQLQQNSFSIPLRK